MKKSISKSFILVIFAILLAGQGFLWAYFLNEHRRHETESLREKIKSLSSLLSRLVTSDAEYFERYLDTLGADEDIISVQILDEKGTVLHERVFKQRAEEDAKKEPLFFLPAVNVFSSLQKSGAGVRIEYGGEKVNGHLRWLASVALVGQALVFLIIGFAIYYFFRRKVGRPVDEINLKLASITGGDLTVDIGNGAEDEIGDIASGLGFLKESLNQTVRKLNLTASDVGMAIKQLNITFGGVSSGAKKQSSAMEEIAGSIKKAADSLQTITAGTVELSDFSDENVTALLEIRAAADEIAVSTDKVFHTLDDSYAALSELSQTAKRISENSQEALSSVEQTSASLEEVSASVREVEEGARQSTMLAEDVRRLAAEEGVLAVADAIEGMEKIFEKVEEAVEVVARLGAQSANIEAMLSVIKNVTEQTNLLSLNAAILAAQAGEYGTGFSVVADEMRALSERTVVSTKDIADVVKTIHKGIKDVVLSIEEAMRLVEEGKEIFYAAGASTGKIVEAAQNSARMSYTIQRATEEQSKGLSQIAVAAEHVRDMIFKMAYATEEQSKSSNYMLVKIGEVKDLADSTKKGTQDLAGGTRHITKNIELANERIRSIKAFVHGQQKINEGITDAVEQVKVIGLGTLRDVEEISFSLGTLEKEIGVLKKGMETFKVDDDKVHSL